MAGWLVLGICVLGVCVLGVASAGLVATPVSAFAALIAEAGGGASIRIGGLSARLVSPISAVAAQGQSWFAAQSPLRTRAVALGLPSRPGKTWARAAAASSKRRSCRAKVAVTRW